MNCNARMPDHPRIRCELPARHPVPYRFLNPDNHDDPIEAEHGAETHGAFWTGVSPVDVLEKGAVPAVAEQIQAFLEHEEALAWLDEQVERTKL